MSNRFVNLMLIEYLTCGPVSHPRHATLTHSSKHSEPRYCANFRMRKSLLLVVFSGRRELNSAWAFGSFVALPSAWTSRLSVVLMFAWTSGPFVALPSALTPRPSVVLMSAWTSGPSAVLMSYLAFGPSAVWIAAWTSELLVVSMSDWTGQLAGTHGSMMHRLALLANLLLVRPKLLAQLMLMNCLLPSLQ